MYKTGEKGSEAKFYPHSNQTIDECLTVAKMTNDLMVGNTVLRPATVDRLNSLTPLFKQAAADLSVKKARYLTLSAQKEQARADTVMYISHFLQVFNMGVKRGKYSPSERALFQLHVSSEALPNLKGDGNIQIAAQFVVDGEAARIAAGKEAVVNPSGAELQAVYNNFVHLTGLTANADALYADAQKAMRDMRKEGRNLVKHIWHEVEAYYNEGERPRMRKHAREWGVIYARKGGEKTVTGTIIDAATGLPVPAVKLKFAKGKNKTVSDMQGHFTLVTNLLHKQTLLATRLHYSPAKTIIDLKEGEENKCVVKMERSETEGGRS